MTIESPPSVDEKNPLKKILFGIAVDIDTPTNSWEQAWHDLALKVGYTEEQIEEAAAEKRPKLIK